MTNPITRLRIHAFKAKGTYDAVRDGFYLDWFEGWGDGTDMRGNTVAKPSEPGDYDTPVYGSSRRVLARGRCYAPSFEELEYRGLILTGVLAGGNSAPVFVDHMGSTKWAPGRGAEAPVFQKMQAGFPLARWELAVKFASPNRYGDVTEVATGANGTPVVAINRGNAEASSKLTVAGAMGGYSIVTTRGDVYQVTTPVTVDHPHTIDLDTGDLMRDGLYLDGVSFGGKWTVPGGGALPHTLVPTSGTGTLTIATPPTYS